MTTGTILLKGKPSSRRNLNVFVISVRNISFADSPWGQFYIKKKAEGHPIYSHALFYTIPETIFLVEKAGFKLQTSRSSLFWEPDCQPPEYSRIESGVVSKAGFVGLLFDVHHSNL